MDTVRQDIRFAARTLRRNPGFAAVAVLTLGLGIGATTAIFSVVNAVLVKPLPYREPERLVAVTRIFRAGTENRIGEQVAMSDLVTLREEARTVESAGGLFFTRMAATVGDTAYFPNTGFIDAGLLETLGTAPALGTNFEPGAARHDTVIISHAFWQQAFGGAADVLGKPIFAQGRTQTVRGVLAEGFEVPRTDARFYRGRVDLFMPVAEDASGNPNYWGVARLAPDVNVVQAQEELRNIDAALPEQDDWSVRVTPLLEERTRAARQPLLMFLGLGAILLLIACTNVMNLLLSRGAARDHEMAIRKANGATSRRLLRQQLTETLCLAALGSGVGLAFAAVAIRVIEALSPLRLPITQGLTLDVRVFGFSLTVCLLAALLVGLIPALVSSFGARALAARGASTGTTARVFPRTQKGLTIAQISLCVCLLAAAGVLVNNLWRLNTIDRGFESEQILGFELTVPGAPDEWGRFVGRALEEIASLPNVSAVGYVTFLPPEMWAGYFRPFRFDGPPPENGAPGASFANTLMTSAAYFRTMGIALVGGRRFDPTDDANAPRVAIVNEAFARRYLPDENPIGRRIVSDFDTDGAVREIVGVVSDTRDRGLGNEPLPTMYLPYLQGTLPYGAIALRTRGAPGPLLPEIRRRLRAVNPDVPVASAQSLDERIRDSLREPRFYALLASVCAVMAVLFVSVGLYGVVSYSVSRRTVELGVRMALGSSRGRVMHLILREGGFMALTGAGAGLALALVSTRGLRSLLFEVSPVDPPTLTASVVLVVGVALLAAYVPAHRASRLSPMTALRYE